ncbi:MAG: hypothetical protein ACRDOL_43545 [Streptosporangiaceae bacterium]
MTGRPGAWWPPIAVAAVNARSSPDASRRAGPIEASLNCRAACSLSWTRRWTSARSVASRFPRLAALRAAFDAACWRSASRGQTR